MEQTITQGLLALTVLPLQLTLRVQTSIYLPRYNGATLRGGFGTVFKETVCVVAHVRTPIRRLLSRGQTSPLYPPLHFFPREIAWRLVANVPFRSHPCLQWFWSRSPGSDAPDTHQDQGLAWTSCPVARRPAPGPPCASDNPRSPAVSHCHAPTSRGSPNGVHLQAGSQQRDPSLRGPLAWAETRTNHICWLCTSLPCRLVPQPNYYSIQEKDCSKPRV
jgi:hypothetical protein